MKKLLTPTLAIVIAAGLAAGIALARPASSADPIDQVTASTSAGFLNAQPIDAAPDEAIIEIVDFDFGAVVVVAPGETITVTNLDGSAHTVTSDDGLFDTGTIDTGTAVTFVAPTEPGTYTFFCAIHPSMQGELVVQG